MAEWRWQRGWSEEELADRLVRAHPRIRNFREHPDELSPARGWNHVWSRAAIAREPAGPPEPGGAFQRARALAERFEFSDPRIVVAHFSPATPLLGRILMLECKALGLRFLSPVVVCDIRTEAAEQRSTYGYCLATLHGHLERGQEWFLLSKDHRSGEVRFEIEAFWRSGELPGWWAWLGFQALGRRYQRAWHRLAHVRLRRLIADGAPPPLLSGVLAHEGIPVPTEPVQLYARRARLRRAPPRADEGEQVRRERLPFTAMLAATCGARSMLPPALLLRAYARAPHPPRRGWARRLCKPAVARAFGAAALGELAADKLPFIPPRTDRTALAGRIGSGALVGYAIAAQGRRHPVGPALLGAACALAGTFGFARLRGALNRRVPNVAGGLIEDAIAAATAQGLVALLGARAR